MAFNMSAFLGGAATGVVKRIDDMERKAEKKADRAYTASEKDRLYSRAKRDKENAITKELTEKLSVFYNSDQVPDIMSNGAAAARHAISRGEYYMDNGMDASVAYQMPKNDITNVNASAVGSVGDVTAASEALSSGAPEGLGGGSFASRFVQGPKKKSWETLAAFQMDLLERKINAVGNPEEIAEIEKDESLWLEQAAALEDAKRKAETKNKTGTEPIYSDESRRKLINDAVTYHRLSLDVQADIETGIVSGIEGNNNLQMAEIRAASDLTVTNNNGFKEVQLGSRIKSMVENATVSLNEFAKNKVRQEGTAYASWTALQAAITDRTIVAGSTYAYQTTIVDDKGQATTAFQGGTYLGEYGKSVGIGIGEDGEATGFLNLPTTYSSSVQFNIIKPKQ
tara:strand:+ start:459 stop:1649 length:1191 start_codon:yes stop_codon:yes gene_type:complete